MGADASDTDPDATASLYDPPESGEDLELEPTTDHEVLHLDIPQDLARRLLEVATHLGLTPSMVASRAIELVCDEVGTVDDDALSTDTLLQQYQARLDLLHVLEEAGAAKGEQPSWDAVDDIIQAAEDEET